MNKKIIAFSVMSTLLTVAGCGSVPRPVIPDGNERTPINSQLNIDDYNNRRVEIITNIKERAELARQIELLQHQIAETKLYILALTSAEAKNNFPKSQSASFVGAMSEALISERETLEVRDQSVVFRVTHPFAKTAFNPTDVFELSILKAAREGRHIEVRGRTDSNVDDDVNKRIAFERASRARAYLVKNGIQPNKIRVSYLASGGFLADNNDDAGKARNRRVEIEVMDFDARAFKANESFLVGSVK